MDRVIRIAAALIVAAGIAAAGLAMLAAELGLSAETARGTFGWRRITLLIVGVVVAAVGAALLARPRIAARLVDCDRMGPMERAVRISAALLAAAGVAGAGLAIFAEELGVGAEAARGIDGWRRISLLVAGGVMLAVGAILMARPRIVSGRINDHRARRQHLDEPEPERGPIPRVVWLITAVFGFLLLLYSVLFPTYRGPDEPMHADLILYAQDTQRYPRDGERFTGQSVMESLHIVHFGERSRDLAAADAPPRDLRPLLDDVSPHPGHVNQLAPHPPLYYYTLALASEGVDLVTPRDAFSRPFDQTVWILRFLNLLLLLPLPMIAYSLARLLRGSQEAATAAAILPLGIPQLTHIGSALNIDNLLTLLVALCTLFLVIVAYGDLSKKTTIGVGVVGGLAMLTKGSALFIPAWVALAYGVAGARTGRWARAGALLGVAIGLIFAFGGWWWLLNLFTFGGLQPPAGPGWGLPPAPPEFTPDVRWWTGVFITGMLESYWGFFGWLDVRVPLWAILLGSVALVGGAALGFLSRGGRWSRVESILLPSVVAIALVAMAASGAPAWAIVLGGVVMVGGLALALGIIGLAGDVILAFLSRGGRRSRAEALIVVLSVGGLVAVAVYVVDPPLWAIVLGSVVGAGGIALALLSRGEGMVRADSLLAVLPAVAIGALVTYIAYNDYVATGQTGSIQGRYLFPGVVGLAAVAAVGAGRLLGGARRYLPAGALVLVAAIQTAGVLTALHFYWAAETRPVLGEVRSLAAWSPWPGELLILPAAIGLMLVAWLGREIARTAIAGPTR